MLTLFTYFRSSASYRVRIGLALKGLPYTSVPIHLLRNGGEQHASKFAAINPAQLVPVLVDGFRSISQSLAILEYLDERYPRRPLLPSDAVGRARVRAIAQSIACEIHPLNNLRVLQRLEGRHGFSEEDRTDWYRHWVMVGFDALERELRSSKTGEYCHGDVPTLADCFLVPQVANALRYQVALEAFPTVAAIHERCCALPAFAAAAPSAQPDAA